MKKQLTKAQKDAIVSLYEERKQSKLNALRAKAAEGKDVKERIDLILAQQKQLEDRLANLINPMLEELNRLLDGYLGTHRGVNPHISGGTYYDKDVRLANATTRKELERNVPVDLPDFPDTYKIRRDLELEAMKGEFDVEEFINKYLL